MFQELIEASKKEISKGAYQLKYDAAQNIVLVIDKKSGIVNYIVESEADEMLSSTYIYFGIKNLQLSVSY